MAKNIIELREDVDAIYGRLNKWLSADGERTELIKLAYPELNGVQDADAVSELMLLRDSLNSLARVCNYGIEHINAAIETKE